MISIYRVSHLLLDQVGLIEILSYHLSGRFFLSHALGIQVGVGV